MHEPGVMSVDMSVEQWIAFVGFVVFTIGFFIWVAKLVRNK